MDTLKNKVVLITGASSGFGKATAYAFAREGANLILNARRKERLEEIKKDIEENYGVQVYYYVGDAKEEETAINTVNLAIEMFGKIDILLNNAGIGIMKSIIETTLDDYDEIMDTNVRSAFAFSKYTIPHMLEKKQGHIIMVSSVTGIKGAKDETVYAASKFAIRGLGQSLLDEYLDQGIKTTVFCPHAGFTEFMIGKGRDQKVWENKVALTPEDVATSIVSVCKQTNNCYISELHLASNHHKFF